MTALSDDLLAQAAELKGYAEKMKAAYEKLELERDALLEALEGYDQIVRITIKRLIRQYGNENDEYAAELTEKLSNACEVIAKAKGGE